MRKTIKWEPDDFRLETTSCWSFPERGNWATHDGKWRGNWSPYIPRNVILRYSKEGDYVLDQFAGGGTTLVEAKLLNRNIIGVDCNEKALKRCKTKIDFNYEPAKGKVLLKKGDARHLDFIKDSCIDLICTHPPYANIIKYSDNLEEDLSLFSVNEFLEQMKSVASECFRVLKRNSYCAILMGDTRINGFVIPLSFKTMNLFQNAGFELKETIIKQQHNCKSTDYWSEMSVKNNFLLLAHEYLMIFKKTSISSYV